jgi:hypothetical protein
MTLKCSKSIAAAGALLWLVGCASAQKVTVLEPVGPALTGWAGTIADGKLQVYSARERAPVDLNREEFLWNNDFGRNDFLYEPAHTGYTIFSQDGKVLKQAGNACGLNDGKPALVTLAAGSYQIEAEAERGGGASLTVDVPVVIKTGQTTVVHLERDWKPSTKLADKHAFVQAYDGRFIGWRAQGADVANSQ